MDSLLQRGIVASQPRGYLLLVWAFKVLPSFEPCRSAGHAYPGHADVGLSHAASGHASVSPLGKRDRPGVAPGSVPVSNFGAPVPAHGGHAHPSLLVPE